MRKNSIKNTRINSEVQRELANIIRGEIKDPRIHPLTSVVTAEVAPDLKTCKAYISVLGDQEAQKKTLEGLNSAVGYINILLELLRNYEKHPVSDVFVPGGNGGIAAGVLAIGGIIFGIIRRNKRKKEIEDALS